MQSQQIMDQRMLDATAIPQNARDARDYGQNARDVRCNRHSTREKLGKYYQLFAKNIHISFILTLTTLTNQ